MASSIEKFFEYPEEPKKNTAMWIVFFIIMYLVLQGIFSNLRAEPDAVFASQIYSFFILTMAMIGIADKIPLIKSLGFAAHIPFGGKNKWYAVTAGVLFGVFMVAQKQAIGINLLQLSSFTSFLFKVVLAPILEEGFFRQTMFPTLARGLNVWLSTDKGWLLALVGVNVAFAWFHMYVYHAVGYALLLAFVIGVLYTIGNYLLKDSSFSTFAHIMNNMLLWFTVGGMIG